MKKALATLAVLGAMGAAFVSATSYESYSPLFDAEYIGSEACGSCHTKVYEQWYDSPHANMVRRPTPESVVGDFDGGTYFLPPEGRVGPEDDEPMARMLVKDGEYFVMLRWPGTRDYVPIKVEYVVGYQYRQVYVGQEPGGILRRLPLQWSVARQEYFPYWNYQAGITPTAEELWSQMTVYRENSSWNVFCGRCHTTHLQVERVDEGFSEAEVEWSETGIGCEACHGPGSLHEHYFETNYVNRIAAFLNSKVRRQPVAYIVVGTKLTKGQDLSICGRCHGPDIHPETTAIYRAYEPGYSREGRINDISEHFREVRLFARDKPATVECWEDARPKGIGMLFRSFIESACYQQGEVRCYDCHQVHANKEPATDGILEASEVSDAYCTGCHDRLAEAPEAHTHHAEGTAGSYCYDCHMPKHIMGVVGGVVKPTRTHWMSSVPDPVASERFGLDGAPNACSDCHADEGPAWARERMLEWWPSPG